ncbi:hypothetical protein Bca4012_056366 [Brassica carinata]|uniref:Uncharacterized protein n=1 Tax=Brassica carinata TaxID=52824 RepID=A0A8X7W0C0_BRACI|nr:hypothetical protein Bca52824_013810 [Brassica carinata]
MPPPAMLAFDDGLDNEWKGFTVFPEENPSPNPNYNLNFLVKKAILEGEKTTGPIFSRPSEREDSFRMVLPPAMPPPRDSAVPLPMLPEPMRIRKKLSHQESSHFPRKSRYSEKPFYKEDDFKCNAFCLSLPGFGKQKSKRQDSMEKKMISTSSFTNSTVSTRSSVEIFECGSWASTTALTQDNGRRYVQELVTSRSSIRDYQRSAETSPQRRVRFSTPSSASVSCPTSPRSCITPRLRKARDDFNAFLSTQDA